jgi:hypothetical protein
MEEKGEMKRRGNKKEESIPCEGAEDRAGRSVFFPLL